MSNLLLIMYIQDSKLGERIAKAFEIAVGIQGHRRGASKIVEHHCL